MNKRHLSLFSLMFVIMIIGSLMSIQAKSLAYQDVNNDITTLVQGNTDFAFDLYGELVADNDDNLIFSPYSISLAMAMLYAGANGETATQIADVMHFDLPPEQLHSAFGALNTILQSTTDEFTLNVVNAMWAQQDFQIEDVFLSTLSQNYDSGLQTINFSQSDDAHEIIRQWITDMTEGRITDMPPPSAITSDTVLALVNAIYFSGEWTNPFSEEMTYDGTFNLSDGSRVTVPMMVNDSEIIQCHSGDGFSAIQLPYGLYPQAVMFIIIPDSVRFDEFEANFDLAQFQNIRSAFNRSFQVGFPSLTMPRFEFTTQFDMNDTLMDMGMTAPFAEGANFSGISPASLLVDYIGHSATISVDERGTETTAVETLFVFPVISVMTECQNDIIADRPFIFTIYDNETQAILFLGRVMNPSE